MHRAIVSLKEELEAVDWYQQRAEACSDEELRGVLVHNKNEEIEHAMIRTSSGSAVTARCSTRTSKTYLNAKGADPGRREAEKLAARAGGRVGRRPAASSSLGIGSLKGGK